MHLLEGPASIPLEIRTQGLEKAVNLVVDVMEKENKVFMA
jgi:hypothetical protein